MRKIIKLGLTLAFMLLITAMGVYAVVTSVNFNIGSSVYFEAAEGVELSISGRIAGGLMDIEANRNYFGKTYVGDAGGRVSADAERWDVDKIAFTASGTITYILTFTNDGSNGVTITVNAPTPAAGRLTLTGGIETAPGVYGVGRTATISLGESVTFGLTLKLSNLDSDLSLTDFNFNVVMAKV